MTHFAVSIALFAIFLWSLWISPASSPKFGEAAHTQLQHTWAKDMLVTLGEYLRRAHYFSNVFTPQGADFDTPPKMPPKERYPLGTTRRG